MVNGNVESLINKTYAALRTEKGMVKNTSQ